MTLSDESVKRQRGVLAVALLRCDGWAAEHQTRKQAHLLSPHLSSHAGLRCRLADNRLSMPIFQRLAGTWRYVSGEPLSRE